jgi:[citrate (pro-3S)-lyase] ligase
MNTMYFRPATGYRLEKIKAFLATLGLGWDSGVEYTVALEENDVVVATGSRQANVFKCIGVSPDRQGEGLSAMLLTELVKDAIREGFNHQFLYTSPASARTFAELGFYPVAGTDEAVFMENVKDGVKQFAASLETRETSGLVSAIVANCNPFTNGHRYLVETAANASELVHLFILSEDKSRFSATDRMNMVVAGVEDLKNVIVHPTSDYMISSATFPDYFIKEKARAESINCTLDLTVFAQCFAKPLGISRRYVGTEPLDPVTLAYNRQMRAVLPPYGIEVAEIPRKEQNGHAISASRVRQLLDEGKLDEIQSMVPAGTFRHLSMMEV